MKFLLAFLVFCSSTAAEAQYYGPYGPPRGWMPMGPPQDPRRTYGYDFYGDRRYDDGAGRWLQYPGPRDYYGVDPRMPRQPYPPPPRGGFGIGGPW